MVLQQKFGPWKTRKRRFSEDIQFGALLTYCTWAHPRYYVMTSFSAEMNGYFAVASIIDHQYVR